MVVVSNDDNWIHFFDHGLLIHQSYNIMSSHQFNAEQNAWISLEMNDVPSPPKSRATTVEVVVAHSQIIVVRGNVQQTLLVDVESGSSS